ncbi:MAG: SDR family oxidoreductase [Chloroflexi bacterium]|nr:SDR family oxidoreductase [Chloroflexota bacterium]
MKLLFVGGTGLISSACSELAVEQGHELYLLNRAQSSSYSAPRGSKVMRGDVSADRTPLFDLLSSHKFDAVVDFIAFEPADIERDIALFRGRTEQFVFISSASAYQKPPARYLITEQTPLENPYWEYSRNKINCENMLMRAQGEGFPVTIIRPSLTYGPSQIPLAVSSWRHPWTVIDRMLRGQKVIVPGDGTSLWVLTWNVDFAHGLLGLLGNPHAIGEAFHITSEEVLTWNQIYLEVYRALNLEPNLMHIPSDLIARFDDHALGSLIGDKSNSVVFDNSKIRRFVPDFKCKVGWAEGLRKALAWFDADDSRKSIDHSMNSIWGSIIKSYENA